jgi:hypothetical protein
VPDGPVLATPAATISWFSRPVVSNSAAVNWVLLGGSLYGPVTPAVTPASFHSPLILMNDPPPESPSLATASFGRPAS